MAWSCGFTTWASLAAPSPRVTPVPPVPPMPTTSRSRPGRTVQIWPVVALMLNMPPAPCSRMEYRSAALSVSGSSASVASTVIMQVPVTAEAPWWVTAWGLARPPLLPSPGSPAGPTWFSPLHHAPREDVLLEERPVVVLVHHNDLQVGGVLQRHATQVQREGFQLWAQSRWVLAWLGGAEEGAAGGRAATLPGSGRSPPGLAWR